MVTEKDTIQAGMEKKAGLGIRHLQIAVMSVCASMLYMVRSSMGAAILAMTDKNNTQHSNSTDIEIYEWDETTRGLILSSFFCGYTIMQIPAGILGKKFGGKPLLLYALVINGILCLATPTLAKYGDWIAVCLVRVVMGLTQACFMPSFHTLLGKWAPPEERTRLCSFAYAGIQIGTIISMPLCGILASSAMGWKLIYYSMGCMAILTSLLWWACTASSPGEHRLIGYEEREYIESSLQTSAKELNMPIPWRKILTSLPLLGITVAHIGCNWSFTFFLVEIPSYMKKGLGIDLASSTLLSALPFATQWLASILFSILCQHICNRQILSLTQSRKLFNSIGSFCMAFGFITMSFLYSDQKVMAIIVLCLTVGIFGSNFSGFMLNHIDLSPNFGGLMFSITNCAANLIGIFVPLLTGFILGDEGSDIGRWRIMFFISAGLIILTDIIYRILSTSELQSWNNIDDVQDYKLGVINNEFNGTEKNYQFTEPEQDDQNEKHIEIKL